jgi:hypothetical protein
MKIGTQDRSKLIAAVILTALALLLMAHWFLGSESSAFAAPTERANGTNAIAIPTAKKKVHESSSLDPTLHYALLEMTENERYEGSGRNIFRSYRDEPPLREIPAVPEPNPSPLPDQPTASSIQLKFFGLATISLSERKACLTQDGDVFIGGEGDIIDRRYRIVRIGTNTVELEDLVDNRTRKLTLER